MVYFADYSEYRFGLQPTPWGPDGPPSNRPEGLNSWLWDFPEPEPIFGRRECNLGWLGPYHDFPRGVHDATFSKVLDEVCRSSTYHSWRGFQKCELCGADVPREPGPGEIRVEGSECVYASPTLIYHYVTEHAYAPPADFVGGILRDVGRVPPCLPGTRRRIPPDLMVPSEVDLDALGASVLNHLEQSGYSAEFREVEVAPDGDNLLARAVFTPVGVRSPLPRVWRVPRDAVLNLHQGTCGIASMLSGALNESEVQAFRTRFPSK